MKLRGVGSVGVVNATITLNPDGSYERLAVEKDPKEKSAQCGALISEVERALKAAVKDAELPNVKKTYKYTISFCLKTKTDLLKSDVSVGDDAIIVTSYADVDVAETSEPQKKESVEMPEKMPTFQGGDLNKFVLWLQTNVKYPAEAVAKSIQGRVIFSFVVNKDGSVGSFEALKSPDKLLTDEVERVFNTSPKWEPAEQDGKKVNVKFTVPIIFKMEE